MIRTATAAYNRTCIHYLRRWSTRETTMRYATILKEEHGFEVMPHLTLGHSTYELMEILEGLQKPVSVMALRPCKAKTNSG